ncbi:hypothetical protein B0H34DRAFT_793428 [Crassisporium funariophilum]|nr:hypothetical protein B0H34DRAFT_793428 [Crassisporium funariophilum]
MKVEYIWKRRWSKSKALFLTARYFGDLLLISVCVGVIGLKYVGTGSMVIILITQVIMQLRIKALYGPKVSLLISVFWVIEVIAVMSLGVASLLAIDVSPYTLESVRMCNPTFLPKFAFLFWVPVIAFETFLFALAFRMAYQNWLEIGNWRGASLLHIVLRDNFQFFICAFAIYIVTAATWLTADPRYFTVPGSFSCSFTTIMGCRLILNLCQAFHEPRDPIEMRPQSIWAATTSRGIRFVTPAETAMSISIHRGPIGSSHLSSHMSLKEEKYEMHTLGITELGIDAVTATGTTSSKGRTEDGTLV